LKLVDFPGHGSQRLRVGPYLTKARGIVFVVDANVPKKGLQPASEYVCKQLDVRCCTVAAL